MSDNAGPHFFNINEHTIINKAKVDIAPPVLEKITLNEEKYRNLIEKSPDIFLILEGDLIHYINESGARLLKADSAKNILGKSLWGFIPFSGLEFLKQSLEKISKNYHIDPFEIKVIRLNGTMVDIEVVGMDYENGRTQLFLRNITERKKAEEAAYKREQEFKTLTENSQDIILRLNTNYQFLYINKALTKETGLPSEFYIGKTLMEVNYPSERFKDIENQIDEVVKLRKVISTFFNITRPGENIQYNYLTCVPEYDQDETVTSVLITLTDITELKINEQKLILANKDLDRLVYSASHELKAPLKSVIGLTRLAEVEMKNSNMDMLGRCLKEIEKSVLRLDRTIKDIIDYSRNSRQGLESEEIKLRELIEEVLESLHYMEGSNRIKKTIDITGSLTLTSDRRRLFIVLNNLISNSIKYYDPDKDDQFFIIKAMADHDTIFIQIEDNGIGINEKLVPKLFEMFFRATVKSEGAGLGLYIVKEIIKKLNGRIDVTSIEGEKTIFNLEIPKLS